jgi:DHA1 family inner membrane transport protein
LIGLLGLTSMTVNPILIALAVRFAHRAPTLASALSTSAFNLGTAVGSWIAGRALDSSLGELGPPVTGTVIAALTLVPLSVLALTRLSRAETNTNHGRQTFDNDEANGLRVSSH